MKIPSWVQAGFVANYSDYIANLQNGQVTSSTPFTESDQIDSVSGLSATITYDFLFPNNSFYSNVTTVTQGQQAAIDPTVQFWVDPNHPTQSIVGPNGETFSFVGYNRVALQSGQTVTVGLMSYQSASAKYDVEYEASSGLILEYDEIYPSQEVVRNFASASANTPTVWLPLTSDFDGDGVSDILLRNGAGVTYLWTMNGTTVANGSTTSTQVGTNWQVTGIGDFNGDGKADLLWSYNNAGNPADPLNGVNYITYQNGATSTGGGVVQQLPAVWNVAAVGDFSGDGIADILYRNSSTGQTYLDIMNGTQVSSSSGFTSQQVPDPKWQVAGVGDFDGDGHADILWRYDNTANPADPLDGAIYEWTMNGTAVTGQGLISNQPGSDRWTVAGTGDFDGNGTSDILFRYENTTNPVDPLNGLTYIDFMNGTNVTSGAPTQWQVDNSWTIASIGDYNSDSTSDILFQHAGDGATYIWDMNGTSVIGSGFTSAQSGPGWTVQNGALIG